MLKNRLMNTVICEVQNIAVKKFGDSIEVNNIIRSLNEELKNSEIHQFESIKKSYIARI